MKQYIFGVISAVIVFIVIDYNKDIRSREKEDQKVKAKHSAQENFINKRAQEQNATLINLYEIKREHPTSKIQLKIKANKNNRFITEENLTDIYFDKNNHLHAVLSSFLDEDTVFDLECEQLRELLNDTDELPNVRRNLLFTFLMTGADSNGRPFSVFPSNSNGILRVTGKCIEVEILPEL